MKTIVLALSLVSSIALAAPKAQAPKASPVAAGPALTEVATCTDGKVYSNATGDHRGACSGHGGVASWADGSPVHSHGHRSSYR